jgi:hypothetical protein
MKTHVNLKNIQNYLGYIHKIHTTRSRQEVHMEWLLLNFSHKHFSISTGK